MLADLIITLLCIFGIGIATVAVFVLIAYLLDRKPY